MPPFDDLDVLEMSRPSRLASISAISPQTAGDKESSGEENCAAFGYLRGAREWAHTLEFRFRDGNTVAFPYCWLGPWTFNPSRGLLLRFTGDVVTLVLIAGSNLNMAVNPGSVNLTDRGIARHRITYIKEMNEDELRRVGTTGPTIDKIVIEEFQEHDALQAWLKQHAPGFVKR